MEDIEKRITELEVRLSFQDSTIESLNGVVTDQHQQISALTEQLKKIKDQILKVNLVEATHTKPPHY